MSLLDDNKMVYMGFRMDTSMRDDLYRLANERDMSMSKLAKRALREFLAREKAKEASTKEKNGGMH